MSTRSIEEVAAVSDGPKWFQVYTWKDRGLVKELVERAAAAGYEALWLTVDTAVLGRRERDVAQRLRVPAADRARRRSSTASCTRRGRLDFLTHEPMIFANVAHHAEHGSREAIPMAEHVMRNFDQKLSWTDVEWLQSIWSGPIVLKGIQTVDDAQRAVDVGVQGIGLSNHGGRQLDGAPVADRARRAGRPGRSRGRRRSSATAASGGGATS